MLKINLIDNYSTQKLQNSEFTSGTCTKNSKHGLETESFLI